RSPGRRRTPTRTSGCRRSQPDSFVGSDGMADRTKMAPENVPGKWYVDVTCIDCDLCRETAPGHFTRQDEGGYSYVYLQPATPAEVAACLAALEECPVEA